MQKELKIGDFTIGPGSKVFIIAELSANHGGSLETAIETIKAAKRAGADAIKIQTYTPDTITLDSRNEDFKVNQGTLWDGKYLYELYKEAYTPWEWHAALFETAKKEGLICFSSPFDVTAVDLLESLHAPAYKIASFEITDIPLIEYTASKGKPMILSTGIAKEDDIRLAIETCIKAGNDKIILLKCTSSYPAPVEEANMLMIEDFRKRFNVLSGLSDHTMGVAVPVVATVFGAKVIEKHFILDRSVGGPDAAFSLTATEFAEMVRAVRDAELSLGKVDYTLTKGQLSGRAFTRSLYVVKDIKQGEPLTLENVKSIRPGYGLHPRYLPSVLGRKAARDLTAGTRLSLEVLI